MGRLQLTLGEGPCIDAYTTHRPVLEPDLLNLRKGRWPGYAPAATALGIRAVFSLPLQVGAAGFGAMDVYRVTAGSLSAHSLGLALTFADVVTETLLDVQDGSTQDDAPSDLDDVLDAHYVVYQAQGMTMVDLGVSLVDALARLRAHAFAEQRQLHDVARDVVEGRLRLAADAP